MNRQTQRNMYKSCIVLKKYKSYNNLIYLLEQALFVPTYIKKSETGTSVSEKFDHITGSDW